MARELSDQQESPTAVPYSGRVVGTVAGQEPRDPDASRGPTQERSDLEVVVTWIINGPPRPVFEAWTKPELFKRW
jgi:hypothetical protein